MSGEQRQLRHSEATRARHSMPWLRGTGTVGLKSSPSGCPSAEIEEDGFPTSRFSVCVRVFPQKFALAHAHLQTITNLVLSLKKNINPESDNPVTVPIEPTDSYCFKWVESTHQFFYSLVLTCSAAGRLARGSSRLEE